MKKLNLQIIYKVLLIVFAGLFSVNPAFSQEEEEEKVKDKRPARPAFESTHLIDNQTVVVPGKGTLQMDMQHRFGTFKNGSSDFWGLWAPSNIRIGMNYSIIDDLSIGIGATKFNKVVDLNVKYNFLKQTRSWSIPVSITYYGSMGIDTRNESNFNESVHRLSYFNELIFGSRITSKLSLQLVGSISHHNVVDSLYSNDIFAVSFNGRYKFSSQSSIIFGYDQQINTHEARTAATGRTIPRSNLSIGIEVSTSSHAFQIFIANFQNIVYQNNYSYNTNDFREGISHFLLGFNITRLWSF
jgi:hypothetical protein